MELRYCEKCGDIIQLEGKADPAHPTEHFVCPRCQGVAGEPSSPAGNAQASAPVSLEKVLDSTSMNLFSSNTILIKRKEAKEKEEAVRQSRLKLADEVAAGSQGNLDPEAESEDLANAAGSAVPSRNARKLQFRCLHCRAVLMVRPVDKASRIICPKCKESLYIDQTGIVSRRPAGAKAAPPAGTAVAKPGSARMAVQDDSSLLDPAARAAAAAPPVENSPLPQGKSFRAPPATVPAAPSRSFRTEASGTPVDRPKSFRTQNQAAPQAIEAPAPRRSPAAVPQPSKSYRQPAAPPPRQPSSAVRKPTAVARHSDLPSRPSGLALTDEDPIPGVHGLSKSALGAEAGLEWDRGDPASSHPAHSPLGASDLGGIHSLVKGAEPFSTAADVPEAPRLLAELPVDRSREAAAAGLVGDLTAEEDFSAGLEEKGKEKEAGRRRAPEAFHGVDWATSSAILVRAAAFAILLAAPFLAAGLIVTPKVSDAEAAVNDASPLAVFEKLGEVVQQGVGKLSRHLESWSGVEK